MSTDWDAWRRKLDTFVGTSVVEMSPDNFKTYVYYFPLKTARATFDWTGATPIVDDFCLIVGRVPDGAVAPEHFEFISELKVYYAPRPGKKFVNRYKKDDADGKPDRKNKKQGQNTLADLN